VNLLAIKMLVGDKLKYFGLLAGMTFAAMMIAQQASIFVGLKSQTGTFIRDNSVVDLWVMDDQVRFSEDQKPIPDTTVQRIRSVDGVEWAIPMYKGWLRARLSDGTRMQVIVVGVDDATFVGAPSDKMVVGDITDLRRGRAVVMDIRDADTKLRLENEGRAIQIGERLSINDNEVEIVGAYRGSPSFFWDPVLYTTYTHALSIAPRERHLTSFVLVKVKDGADVAAVQRRINEQTRFVARTGPEFERITSDYILEKTGILVNFGMAVGLGFVIGLIVTGQTFFNFTLDNLRHFASLRAMGVSSLTLVRMVLVQVLTVGVLAVGLGLGIASIAGHFIAKTDLAFLMPWEVLAATATAMLLVGAVAALISLAKVLRLEPAIVFKGA
jgi:putative ABC transport system permease protein